MLDEGSHGRRQQRKQIAEGHLKAEGVMLTLSMSRECTNRRAQPRRSDRQPTDSGHASTSGSSASTAEFRNSACSMHRYRIRV